MAKLPPSSRARSCSASRSPVARFTAGSHTADSSPRTLSGDLAMVSSRLYSAYVLKPSSAANSARSAMISAVMARLSVSLPISPRRIQALNASSRRSRRAENCRNGSIDERDSVMTYLPG